MSYTTSFDGSTASGIALARALAESRAAAKRAQENHAAFMYGYRPQQPARKPEPQLTFKPETPAETRIHAAASKRGWGNRPAPEGEVHFIREGARDVVVTRDALKRVPILADTVVRQLENS
jgi:hypothetical protein